MPVPSPRVSLTLTPEQVDSLRKQLDAGLERLRKVFESGATVQSACFITGVLNLLPCIESGRDFMQQILQTNDSSRDLLQTIFGGDCIRIAHIRSVVEATQELVQMSNFDDNRIPECLEQCKSVESVLKDIGLGVRLGRAQAAQRKMLMNFPSATPSENEEEACEGEHEEEASILQVSVLSASGLACPEYRIFDMTINTAHNLGANVFRDYIHHSRVRVEVGLGNDARITDTARSEPNAGKVDWNDERHFFIYRSEASLRIDVRDERIVRSAFRGHPSIGTATYEFPADFSDGFTSKVGVPIARKSGASAGIVYLEISRLRQKQSMVHSHDVRASPTSWKHSAGRTDGSEGYQFGDLTRTLHRRLSLGGQTPN